MQINVVSQLILNESRQIVLSSCEYFDEIHVGYLELWHTASPVWYLQKKKKKTVTMYNMP